MKQSRVFILGNPRSGTSLLRLMLNQHSSIVAPPESGFSLWWLHKYGNWCKADNAPQKINGFIDDVLSSRKIETWHL
ncbi:MAG: sulfotransferase, partial [Marinirhabdus sp.]